MASRRARSASRSTRATCSNARRTGDTSDRQAFRRRPGRRPRSARAVRQRAHPPPARLRAAAHGRSSGARCASPGATRCGRRASGSSTSCGGQAGSRRRRARRASSSIGSAGAVGRVGIDLPLAMRDATNRDNLILADGDSVIVPQFNAVVTVGGAVNRRRALAYVPGQRPRVLHPRRRRRGTRAPTCARAYVMQPNGRLESVQRRRFLPDGVPGAAPRGTSDRPGALQRTTAGTSRKPWRPSRRSAAHSPRSSRPSSR